MNITVIICAAGRSQRFAESDASLLGARSKLDEDLGGRPVLQRAVELFTRRDDVGAIIVAGPHDEQAFGEFRFRHGDRLGMLGATLCRGGATHRYETVAAALADIPEDTTHVAVHDAARPVTPHAVIDRVFDAGSRHAAVIPGVEVPDTLKRVDAEPVSDDAGDPLAAILGGESAPKLRRVEATVDRTNLMSVQTPQLFEVALLRRAYGQNDLESTDDAGLVERLGEPVVVVPGDAMNIKITRPADVELARLIGGFKPPRDRPSHKKF